MNILHHKSYHVYNKKNIEKVKADEAEAARKEKQKQDRVTLAESESRLTILRQRANANLSAPPPEPVQHINLFGDLAKAGGNEEHEAEVKAKDEQWDKQVTMYLEKGTKQKPWYAKTSDSVEKYKDKDKFKRRENSDSKSRKKKPIQLLEDPLEAIKKQLKSREHREHKHDSKRKPKKEHKEAGSSIEELRQKRREREQEERARIRQIFPDKNNSNDVTLDERDMAYNSQFNKQETHQAHKRRRY